MDKVIRRLTRLAASGDGDAKKRLYYLRQIYNRKNRKHVIPRHTGEETSYVMMNIIEWLDWDDILPELGYGLEIGYNVGNKYIAEADPELEIVFVGFDDPSPPEVEKDLHSTDVYGNIIPFLSKNTLMEIEDKLYENFLSPPPWDPIN